MKSAVFYGVCVIVAAAAWSLVGGCRSGGDGEGRAPTPARVGLDHRGQMRVSPGDRCPVCAMDAAEHRRFTSAILLRDGRTFYFCGTGCMIRSWMHPQLFLGAEPGQLERAVVREYFGGEDVDATTVIFVAGSDVVGPMGPALVPLKNQSDLEVFRGRHGGATSFRLEEMNDERWQAITGKRARPPER